MGKKTVITVVALIVLGVGMITLWGRVEPILLMAFLVILVFFGALFSIDKTLKAHPELALMDGTEIVALRKAEMAAKHITILPAIAQPMPDPQAPSDLPAIAEPEEPEEED